jgi:serine/threonine-protein kinase
VYQRGEFDGRLWIALQYVQGTDAEAALRAGAMSPQRAVRIVAEVARPRALLQRVVTLAIT